MDEKVLQLTKYKTTFKSVLSGFLGVRTAPNGGVSNERIENNERLKQFFVELKESNFCQGYSIESTKNVPIDYPNILDAIREVNGQELSKIVSYYFLRYDQKNNRDSIKVFYNFLCRLENILDDE